jgi:hypothetical protein
MGRLALEKPIRWKVKDVAWIIIIAHRINHKEKTSNSMIWEMKD